MHELILGDEHDDALYLRLRLAVQSLGGTIKRPEWTLGGSQEVTTYEIELPDGQLEAVAETYAGLSINGPEELVTQIARKLQE